MISSNIPFRESTKLLVLINILHNNSRQISIDYGGNKKINFYRNVTPLVKAPVHTPNNQIVF